MASVITYNAVIGAMYVGPSMATGLTLFTLHAADLCRAQRVHLQCFNQSMSEEPAIGVADQCCAKLDFL